MKKITIILMVLSFLTLSMTSCNWTKDKSKKAINKTGGIDKISGTQINNKRKLKLKTPQRGEATFSICVYTATDTLCSQESYIEGGYRPKLRLKNSNFETEKWF